MADNQALPLARYRVLDLTRARAGPTCVRQLVDWGARATAWAGRATVSTSRTCTATSGR